jgi:AhpD family alkylhydroperoxidase
MTIDKKTMELISVGASITANCQPCLQYHTNKALEFGADAGEIAEAIDIGKWVRKGAAAKMDQFATEIRTNVPAAEVSKTAGSRCCG